MTKNPAFFASCTAYDPTDVLTPYIRMPLPLEGAKPVAGGSGRPSRLKRPRKAVVAAKGTVAADSNGVLGPMGNVVFA